VSRETGFQNRRDDSLLAPDCFFSCLDFDTVAHSAVSAWRTTGEEACRAMRGGGKKSSLHLRGTGRVGHA